MMKAGGISRALSRHSTGLPASGGGGSITPPAGFVFLTDNQGNYLVDRQNNYLIARS